MDIINAKIKYSFLGVDENSSLYCQIAFEGKNGSSYTTSKIVFSNISFIKDILNTLEVRSWEELSRKFARIKTDDKRVVAIGNLIEDKWVKV